MRRRKQPARGTCGVAEQGEREQQEGWAEEQRGGGENIGDCDSESHSIPWSRVGARETCSHDGSKAGEKREVEAEQQSAKVQGDDQHCSPGSEPLLGWKHEVWVKGAKGVKERERQLREPCDEPRFEDPRVER